MNRWEVINHLIHKNGYERYLEIGVQTQTNFNRVECGNKTGVDPGTDELCVLPFPSNVHLLTSNQFFEQNQKTYDIIFIDGLHEAEQVYKDIINSQKILTEGGTIVCHDCNPTSEHLQSKVRKTSQWCGDTWKAFVRWRFQYDPLAYVVDTDWGCGILSKIIIPIWSHIEYYGPTELVPDREFELDLAYNNLEANRQEWLNLKTVEEFLEM